MTTHALSKAIPYGEGWPFPKRERRSGTVYRTYQDLWADCLLVIAIDQDGSRRGVEIAGELWASVIRPRRRFAPDDVGAALSNDDDLETVLQAQEAWTALPIGTAKP